MFSCIYIDVLTVSMRFNIIFCIYEHIISFLGVETQIVLVEFTVSGKLERRRWKNFKCANARINGERNAEARGKKVVNRQGNARTA